MVKATIRLLNIALILMLVLCVANVFIRYFGDALYFWGNLYCLILASVISLLISNRFEFALSVAGLVVMINNLLDCVIFTPVYYGINDIITTILVAGGLVLYRVLSHERLKINRATVPLMLLIVVKLITSQMTTMIDDKYVFAIGDASVYLLYSFFYLRKLASGKKVMYKVIPILLLAATVNNFQDNTWGDPYHLRLHEILVMGIVIVDLVWYGLKLQFAKTKEAKTRYNHVFIAWHCLLIGAFLIAMAKLNHWTL